MHQKQIHILQPETLQGLVDALINAPVVCIPQLGSHEDIFTLANTLVEGLLESLADLRLVLVA